MVDVLPLPRGITGFIQQGEKLPWVDAPDFKRVCYEAARSMGARVVRVDSADGKVDRNYHAAEVQIDAKRILVLCNAHYPWLALVESSAKVELGSPIFDLGWEDVPAMTQALEAFSEFRVLDVMYLESVPEPQVLQHLWEGEVKQIRLWKPRNIGEIIFNPWD